MIDDDTRAMLREKEEKMDDPIEKGYSNACKDQNFANNVLKNENDPTAKAYKDFADEIDEYVDDHTSDSNESNDGRIVKRRIDFSITRENGKVIHSSETIPLNSLLVNGIGATIGNCPKDGDEFKFNLNIEEDGSINLQIHAPNNKINNDLVSKLFTFVTNDKMMDSNIMNFIHIVARKLGASTGPMSSGPSPWGSTFGGYSFNR